MQSNQTRSYLSSVLGGKALTLLFAMVLAVGIVGCGGEDESSSDDVVGDTSSGLDTTGSDAAMDTVEPDGLAPDVAEDTAEEIAADTLDDTSPELVEEVADETIEEIEEEIQEPITVSDNYKVHPTIEQIYVWSATPELAMEVVDADDTVVATGTTDYQGSLVFRELTPDSGYFVRPVDDADDFTGPLTVMSVDESWPDQSFYDSQILEPGFGYITMRDGVKLSIFVTLPGPVEEGPYPTVVNYSGYSPSRPGESLGAMVEPFCSLYPILCDAPSPPSSLITGILGYATVSVNVRGTGCSGGAYDYFETLQLLDGYDVIEIVASQEWVKHHKVGMVGLSYPGNSQLFVASTTPPSLAAISPMSVIPNTAVSTLAPGGILNDGFALEWIAMVLDKADPYAHGWITEVVEGGDTVCEEHQLLHSQKVDVIAKAYANPYYTDEVAGPLNTTILVQDINVPVFQTGHCQDEQTGPHYPTLFDDYTSAPVTKFTMTNGIHMDGFAPQILTEWFIFLELYVNQEVPAISPELAGMVPMFMTDVYGAQMSLPPNRFEDYPSYDDALADYEAEPILRVIFESGASPDSAAGAPEGTFEEYFDEWPIASTQAVRYYFQPDGTMTETMPGADGGASTWEHDPDVGHDKSLASGGVETLQPDWNWAQPAPGKAVVFETEPLTEDMVLIGSASLDLWLSSTADDADIEVTITELRPDGQESYIQNGWLRASHHTLTDESTELHPVASHYEEDMTPLVPGEWTLVRVEIMPMAHAFRAGSKIRVIIDTPGGSMARWMFKLLEFDTPPLNSVGHNATYPSSLVLPLIPDVEVPTDMPAANALRGQPYRDIVEYTNTPAE